jgi:Fur family ferric uptake transcriptional regulator
VRAPSIDRLQAILRDAGLRATAARVAVLGRLHGARAALSHGEVADSLAEQGLDRATVYRNLVDLTEAGLVRRTDIGDHTWRFEVLEGSQNHAPDAHPHFVCGGCGVVACLPEDAVAIRAVRGAPKALRGKAIAVQVRGLCDSCS